MPQNDMVIANANGATVRADINSALQALASANNGATAPGTTYANQFWFDTANDLLKIRDEANANWVNVASLVGTTWVPYAYGTGLGTLANQSASAISTNLVLNSGVAFVGSLTTISSGTPNFAASGNVVSVTSTATANNLGTVQAGFIGFVHYGVPVTVTHNATSRILPTSANIAFEAGDVETVLSLGGGNWRTVNVQRASGAALLGATTAATQASQEAASDLTAFVSPGRQHFHPSAAKAWARVNGTGSGSLTSSYGVSSMTRNGLGDVTVATSVTFSSTATITPIVASGFDNANLSSNPGATGSDFIIASTSSIRISTGNGTSGRNDFVMVTLSVFGDL